MDMMLFIGNVLWNMFSMLNAKPHLLQDMTRMPYRDLTVFHFVCVLSEELIGSDINAGLRFSMQELVCW